MRVPIIKVRSRDGHEHIVGESPHDLLYIDENGCLQYLNIQCCAGTGGRNAEYTFTGTNAKEGEYSVTGRPEVEFVTLAVLTAAAAEQDEKRETNAVKLQALLKEEFSREFKL